MQQHKKIIKAALFGVLLCATAAVAAQTGKYTTRYYKQVKVVVNGKERAGDGSGQFITRTDKVCYDSKKDDGISVGNGVLKYSSSTDGRTGYSGDSYCGSAKYIFTENFNRLNVFIEDKATYYVYVRAPPPPNVLTCDLIKGEEKSSSGGGGGMAVIPPPIPPVIDGSYYSGGGKTTTIRTPTRREKYVTKEETCDRCNGSGDCPVCRGNRTWKFGYGDKLETTCSGCVNGVCTKCGGKRKVLKGEYITVYE
jgi:hypothetical protein